MRVYLDTAPVIYLVEEVPNYVELVDKRVSVADVIQVASDLTRMECRVKPLREGNTALLHDYDDYFAASRSTPHSLVSAAFPLCLSEISAM